MNDDTTAARPGVWWRYDLLVLVAAGVGLIRGATRFHQSMQSAEFPLARLEVMGTVYSSEHVYIGKKVAVKVLHQRFARYQEAIERFLREARAASSINHPNIVDVTDFGPLDDGGVFFVMTDDPAAIAPVFGK